MAKGIYLGIDSLSRKVKKMYLGIEGVARKVKKGYIGINGIARLFFAGGGKPVYSGELTPLSIGRYYIATTNRNDYAIFACGNAYKNGSNKGTNLVDTYSQDLVHTEITGNTFVLNAAAASTKINSFVAGGFFGGQPISANYTDMVWAIDKDLSTHNVSSLPQQDEENIGLSMRTHALFFPGNLPYGTYNNANIVAYDDDNTKTLLDRYSSTHICEQATCYTNTGFGLVGGGVTVASPNDPQKYVFSYTEDLIAQQIPDLNSSSGSMNAETIGNFSVFVATKQITAYDRDFTKIGSVANLSRQRRDGNSGKLENYIMFIGGQDTSGEWEIDSDLYDEDLVQTPGPFLPTPRYISNASSISGNVIVAGGRGSESASIGSDKVYAFTEE